MSLRDRIRATDDRRFEDIHVESWGETIRVMSMTAADKVTMSIGITDEQGQTDGAKLYQALLLRCCYDPATGEKAFLPEDAEWLLEKAGEAIEPLVNTAMRLNGLTGQAVEEAAKNSESTPTSDSSSN